jgi:hypothetical protein
MVNGQWTHLKAPVFTLVIESQDLNSNWQPYSTWERTTASHSDLKRIMSFKTADDRFYLEPSKPLPLP